VKEKNVKHLTKTLAVVSLLAPITAQPLGIGDIQLHSTLNQKLNAEIRLHLAPGDNPADISVRLASPEKFDKAGIPWNYNLSKIKFKTVPQANGSMAIEVFTREAVTEPFLDFLIEVTWPQGTQFREYTLLLDPPADYRQPVMPTVTKIEVNAEPLTKTQKPVRKPRASTPQPATASYITPQTPTDGEYGPVQRADNLWSIAKHLGEERGVSTNKMMHALFQANPDAFGNGDINILRVGAVLKIPETDAILNPGSRSAEKAASKKPSSETGKAKTPAQKALELEAPIDSKVTDTAQIDEHTRPGTETGEVESGETGAEGAQTGEADLATQNRIDRLEQQLNMMQQLLALKDPQLSALQDGKTEEAQPGATDETVKQPTETKPAPAPQDTKPTPQPPKPQQAPQPAPVPVPEPESDNSSIYYLTVGALSIGILGALGWLWWRKRSEEEQGATDSMFASASQIKLPDSDSSLSVPVIDMNTTGSYDVGTVGESSFISDFTPSDFEAFDTDQGEIDPMSEADVYLAYGRYQQAEDLMRLAIEEQPDKDDYKLKLLEIFYANENKERFAEYAKELANAGKTEDHAFWNKVVDMAKEIMPDSPLLGSTGTAPTAKHQAENTETSIDEETEVQTGEAEEPTESLDFDSETDDSLDFDLDTFSRQISLGTTDDNKPDDDIESIEFDLSKHSEESPAEESKTGANDTLESFDFDFGFEEDTSAKDDNNTPAETHDLEMESFDLNDLGNVESKTKPDQTNNDASSALGEADEFDFTFELGSAKSESGSDEFDLGVSDLTDMDEFETKIDLAKAYIDMGDNDAAKTIAEEVLANGNDEQKLAAQAILNEIK